MVDGHGSVPRNELAALVAQEPNRRPLASQRKIRIAVSVQVGENRAADEAKIRKTLRHAERVAVAAQQVGSGRFGVAASRDTAAEKKVQLTVAVHVCQSERPGGGEVTGNG